MAQMRTGLMRVTTQPLLYGKSGVYRTSEDWHRIDAQREKIPTAEQTINFVNKDGHYIRVDMVGQGPAISLPTNKGGGVSQGAGINNQIQNQSLTITSVSSDRSVRREKIYGQSLIYDYEKKHRVNVNPNAVMDFMGLQKEHQALADAAMQSYKESSTFFGRSAQAIQSSIANAQQMNNEIELSGLLSLGALAFNNTSNINSTGNIEYDKIDSDLKSMIDDPMAAKSYEIAPELRSQIKSEVKSALAAANYRKAANLIEQIDYDVKSDDKSSGFSNDDMIIEFEKNDSGIPKSPFSAGKLLTNKESSFGQVVRRISNRYQAVWAETKGLEGFTDGEKITYMGGVISVRMADHLLESNAAAEGMRMLAAANELLNGIQDGFTTEMISNIKLLVNFVPAVADAMDKLANLDLDSAVKFVSAIPEVTKKAYSVALTKIKELERASPYEKGQILGHCMGFAAAIIATDGVAGQLKAAALASDSVLATRALMVAAKINVGGNVERAFRASLPLIYTEKVAKWSAMIEKSSPKVQDLMTRFVGQSAHLGTALGKTEKMAGAGWDLTEESFQRIAQQAEKISVNLKGIKGIKEKVPVYRGLRTEFVENNMKQHGLSKTDAVFAYHPSQITNVNRFTLGGELGIDARYASESIETAIAELGGNAKGYTFAKKNIQFNNLLDLTDKRVLDKLEIKLDDVASLLKKGSPTSYEIPQVIGNYAKEYGYDGIKFYSAPMRDNNLYRTNWAIFGK